MSSPINSYKRKNNFGRVDSLPSSPLQPLPKQPKVLPDTESTSESTSARVNLFAASSSAISSASNSLEEAVQRLARMSPDTTTEQVRPTPVLRRGLFTAPRSTASSAKTTTIVRGLFGSIKQSSEEPSASSAASSVLNSALWDRERAMDTSSSYPAAAALPAGFSAYQAYPFIGDDEVSTSADTQTIMSRSTITDFDSDDELSSEVDHINAFINSIPLTPVSDKDNYQSIIEELQEPVYPEDGSDKYYPFTYQGVNCRGKVLGKGQTMQAYLMTSQSREPVVIKVYTNPFDKNENALYKNSKISKFLLAGIDGRRYKKIADPKKLQRLRDALTSALRVGYNEISQTGVPIAEIHNLQTIEQDGFVAQEYLSPLPQRGNGIKMLPWTGQSITTDSDKALLDQFIAILNTAWKHRSLERWDLFPGNFGMKNGSTLALLDFSPEKLDKQNDMFQQFIKSWSCQNEAALNYIKENFIG